MAATRPIDKRFLPPVAGVDLEQSLNYINLDDVGESFAYNRYTASRLPYVKGSRPRLEAIAAKAIGKARSPRDRVQKLADYVATEVPWAGFYEKRTGRRCPPDRAMSEEKLISSRVGWCNEQARVFCALTQVVGISSRLLFAGNLRKHYGHVITEVLLPSGWLAVDQSFGFLFEMNGKPVRASRIYLNQRCRSYFQPIYARLCNDLIATLGRDLLQDSFAMCLAKDPLDGFTDIGFHNHFVH